MEKKYIKTFESFKDLKNAEPVNEELLGLGKLFNFLKGIFKKAQDKIKSLETYQDLVNYYKTKLFSPKSGEGENIFSPVLKEYESDANFPPKQFTDQNCFDLVAKMIDPDNIDCVLSTKAIQDFSSGLADEKKKKENQYILETVRNKTLLFFQYGLNSAASFVAGKALPVPAIQIKEKNIKRKAPNVFDTKHLEQLKEKIKGFPEGVNNEARKKAAIDFAKLVLIPKMIAFCNAITEEEVNKFVGVGDTKEDTDVLGSYGVKEEKELVGKDIYYMMDGYDAKAPKKELIGKGKVTAFDDTKGFSIETEKGSKFDKPVDKLLSKVEAEKLLGIKAGEGQGMDYEKLNTIYGEKKEVIYLLPGIEKDKYDPKKKPDEQAEVVGVGQMVGLNDQNNDKSVKFEKDGKTIERSYSDIVGVVGDEQKSEEAKKAAEELGLIKDDTEKMKNVSSYAEFLRKGKEDDVNTIKDMVEDELKKLPKE